MGGECNANTSSTHVLRRYAHASGRCTCVCVWLCRSERSGVRCELACTCDDDADNAAAGVRALYMHGCDYRARLALHCTCSCCVCVCMFARVCACVHLCSCVCARARACPPQSRNCLELETSGRTVALSSVHLPRERRACACFVFRVRVCVCLCACVAVYVCWRLCVFLVYSVQSPIGSGLLVLSASCDVQRGHALRRLANSTGKGTSIDNRRA